jgi:hypothetical protein
VVIRFPLLSPAAFFGSVDAAIEQAAFPLKQKRQALDIKGPGVCILFVFCQPPGD